MVRPRKPVDPQFTVQRNGQSIRDRRRTSKTACLTAPYNRAQCRATGVFIEIPTVKTVAIVSVSLTAARPPKPGRLCASVVFCR